MRNRISLVWAVVLFLVTANTGPGQEKLKKPVKPQAVIELPFPMGGNAEGPETAAKKKDLSIYGPGGSHFIYLEDKNLEPRDTAEAEAIRIPAPGEPGFICEEQPNLYPGESIRETHLKVGGKKKADK